MASICIEHFGREVVGRAADRLLLFARVEYLCRQTEVADFELHALCEEQIAEFKISVDNFLRVNVLTGLN